MTQLACAGPTARGGDLLCARVAMVRLRTAGSGAERSDTVVVVAVVSIHNPRRKKGDKSKNTKVAFVGVLYTLRKTRHGFEGPTNKRLIATFESHEALFRWLHEHAVRRGHGRKRTYFLSAPTSSAHLLPRRRL